MRQTLPRRCRNHRWHSNRNRSLATRSALQPGRLPAPTPWRTWHNQSDRPRRRSGAQGRHEQACASQTIGRLNLQFAKWDARQQKNGKQIWIPWIRIRIAHESWFLLLQRWILEKGSQERPLCGPLMTGRGKGAWPHGAVVPGLIEPCPGRKQPIHTHAYPEQVQNSLDLTPEAAAPLRPFLVTPNNQGRRVNNVTLTRNVSFHSADISGP